jgi:hypothetical protein
VTVVSGRARLRGLAEHHFEEAAVQHPYYPFLQLGIVESNSELKKELYLRPRKKTYSLWQSRMTVLATNLGETHSEMVGFTYLLQYLRIIVSATNLGETDLNLSRYL